MRIVLFVVCLSFLAGACATHPTNSSLPSPAAACHAARRTLPALRSDSLSSRETIKAVAADARAYERAKVAHKYEIAFPTLVALGAGLAISGLITGLSSALEARPTRREEAIGLAASGFGIAAVATGLAIVGSLERRKAVRYFAEYAESCREHAEPSTPSRLPATQPEALPGEPASMPPGAPANPERS